VCSSDLMLAAQRDGRAHVRFVRRFIFGKPHVAIDAKQTVFGRQIGQVFNRSEFVDERVDKISEVLLRRLVFGAVRIKPGFVVMLLKFQQEIQRGLQVLAR
jgi:hypothetical protein